MSETGNAKQIKIVRQLEYYFGDINLVKDAFMQEEMKKDDGWFSLETMLKFQRLKHLAETPEAIVEAMKVVSSDLIELSEDEQKIRRFPNKELPESFREAMNQFKDSAIFVKGFPTETSLSDIQEFLELHGGPTVHIQMRKDTNTKLFKGSVYATFKNKEDAEKFLKSENTTQFRNSEEPLEKLWREEHFSKKKEKAKQEKESRAKERALADAKRTEERAAFERERLLSKIVRGSLLKIDGVAQPSDHEKESEVYKEIRSLFSKAALDFYLDFFDGVLYARFKEENTAATGWQKLQEASPDNMVKYLDTELTGTVLTGDEEERVWALVFEAKKQRFDNSKRGGRGRGRGRGGRGGGRRGGSSRNGGPPSKRVRLDDD